MGRDAGWGVFFIELATHLEECLVVRWVGGEELVAALGARIVAS